MSVIVDQQANIITGTQSWTSPAASEDEEDYRWGIVRRDVMKALYDILGDGREYTVKMSRHRRDPEPRGSVASPFLHEYRLRIRVLLMDPKEARIGEFVHQMAFPHNFEQDHRLSTPSGVMRFARYGTYHWVRVE